MHIHSDDSQITILWRTYDMNRTIMIAATKDQAAMTTNILRIVLNHLTPEYSLSYLVRSDRSAGEFMASRACGR